MLRRYLTGKSKKRESGEEHHQTPAIIADQDEEDMKNMHNNNEQEIELHISKDRRDSFNGTRRWKPFRKASVDKKFQGKTEEDPKATLKLFLRNFVNFNLKSSISERELKIMTRKLVSFCSGNLKIQPSMSFAKFAHYCSTQSVRIVSPDNSTTNNCPILNLNELEEFDLARCLKICLSLQTAGKAYELNSFQLFHMTLSKMREQLPISLLNVIHSHPRSIYKALFNSKSANMKFKSRLVAHSAAYPAAITTPGLYTVDFGSLTVFSSSGVLFELSRRSGDCLLDYCSFNEHFVIFFQVETSNTNDSSSGKTILTSTNDEKIDPWVLLVTQRNEIKEYLDKLQNSLTPVKVEMRTRRGIKVTICRKEAVTVTVSNRIEYATVSTIDGSWKQALTDEVRNEVDLMIYRHSSEISAAVEAQLKMHHQLMLLKLFDLLVELCKKGDASSLADVILTSRYSLFFTPSPKQLCDCWQNNGETTDSIENQFARKILCILNRKLPSLNGITLLQFAARSRNSQILETLLMFLQDFDAKYKAKFIFEKDDLGHCAVFHAALFSSECFPVLINTLHEANLLMKLISERRDCFGNSIFHVLCYKRKYEDLTLICSLLSEDEQKKVMKMRNNARVMPKEMIK